MADQTRPATRPTGVLLFLGIVWLALTLWLTHGNLLSRASAAEAASAAALSLPTVVTGALIAGAAMGLSVCAALTRRWSGWGAPLRRLIAGATSGALLGAAVGTAIVISYGASSTMVTLAVTVGVAGLCGGLLATLPAEIIGAGLAATFGVLVISVLAGAFQAPLKSLLGGGDSAAANYQSALWLGYLTDALCGFAAAMIGYAYLRRTAAARRWPWYALAGGLAGLLLLLSYVITLIGGASLFSRVRDLSPADGLVLAVTDDARLSQALLIFFVGTIVAMIAVGRTLRPAPA